jgi:hypothetical protein
MAGKPYLAGVGWAGVRLPAALLAVAVLLAGCSGGKADADEPAVAAGPAGTGSLRGVVVDHALRPVAGAEVAANGPSGSFNATTDAEGLFGFDDLAPGVYLVEAGKQFYIAQQQAVTVVEGAEPAVARFQITFEASSVPYANLYKLDGFYECGVYTVRVCSNVNILTWVVVCAQTNVCLGNVTQDHSLFFQWVEPGVDFIQTEMAWTPTTDTGAAMSLLIGGGTEEELKEGVGLPAYNGTAGTSPLMLRISNHESEDSWCRRNEQCETTAVVDESRIGTDRALLVQVDTGPSVPVADSCGVDGVYDPEPCGAGVAAQQSYSLFTITFYGYEPPLEWLFAETGQIPQPA